MLFDALISKKEKILHKQLKRYDIYGYDTMAESTVCKWFTRSRSGNFHLEEEDSSIPAVTDDDKVKALIKNNPGHTTQNIAEILHICIQGL